MYFLANSNLHITTSNFFQNCLMYGVLSRNFLIVFLVLLTYNSQLCKISYEILNGGAKESRTPDLLLARQAL